MDNFISIDVPTRNAIYTLIEPEIRFSQVAVDGEVESVIEDFLDEHKRTNLLRSYGIEPDNRLLFFGKVGNGQDMMAEAIAAELALPLYVVNHEALVYEDKAKTVKEFFNTMEVLGKKPCVIYFNSFEVFDAFRVMPSIINILNNLSPEIIVIVGASELYELSRVALNYFDKKLHFREPETYDIEAFLEDFSERANFDFDSCIDLIAEKWKANNDYLSYSMLEKYCVELKKRAIMREAQEKEDKARGLG